MILAKKKTKITEEEVQENGQLKDYPERILVVKTDKTAAGFTQEDISEIKSTITQMTRELNEKILSMFKMKSDSKMQLLQGKLDFNSQNYNTRNEEFSEELRIMNERFDFLKRAEQRNQDVVNYAIVYKENKKTRRLCFDVLKYYAHTKKNVRAVNTILLSEKKNI